MIHHSNQAWLSSALLSCVTIVLVSIGVTCIQLSVALSSDLSRPTYGFLGETSSHITLSDRNGVNVQGSLKDLLGPPIKIAQGFHNLVNGSNMAGIGQSLKSNGAMIGVDSRLLEAAGGAHLFKGGLLLGGAAAKIGAAKTPAGKKFASIVELPVKVIGAKQLAEGKALTELARAKGSEAGQSESRGDQMIQQGNTLRSQGMNQMRQGFTEGIQAIGNTVQQTSGNAASAMKLLPILLEMNNPQQGQQTETTQQEAEKSLPQPHQQQSDQSHHSRQSAGGLTGGSIFGGLGSLLPGATPTGGNDPFLNILGGNTQHRPSPLGQLFGGANHNQQTQQSYAVLNSSNPLTNFLLNPSTNPFLLPITGALDPMANPVANPLIQAFSPNRRPSMSSSGSGGNGLGFGFGGSHGSHNNQDGSQTSSFNLFPGIRFSETITAGRPNYHQQQQPEQLQGKTSQQVIEQHPQQQQHQEKTFQPQQQQHQEFQGKTSQQVAETKQPQQQELPVKTPQEEQHQQQGGTTKA